MIDRPTSLRIASGEADRFMLTLYNLSVDFAEKDMPAESHTVWTMKVEAESIADRLRALLMKAEG